MLHSKNSGAYHRVTANLAVEIDDTHFYDISIDNTARIQLVSATGGLIPENS